MPVLSKIHGIVLRVLIDRTFGVHLHAFYGDSEMVLALNPLRILQSEVPSWVESWVLDWGKRHASELLAMPQRLRRTIPAPLSGHAAAA
jgi:hypothetical protein